MTDRLFKFGSFEEEIMKSMENTLVKYQKDQMYSHEKLAKAVDHLNAAAEIFDDTGFNKESEFITKLIEKIAHGGSHIHKMIEESLPPHSKSPVNNLLEEELSKQEIEDILNKGDKSPAEPFSKSPSFMPPNLEDEEFEELFDPRYASDKKKI